jgi:ATP-dependent Lon protease
MALKRIIKNYIKKEGVRLLKEKGIPLLKKQVKRRLAKKR